MKPAKALAGLAALTLLSSGLAACGGSDSGGDGTFVFASTSDPGALDPQMSAVSALFGLNPFAYDALVAVNEQGEIGAQLADSWSLDGDVATFHIKDGITCSDGTAFTASLAAANLNWMSDPANLSPYLGAFLPAGITSVGDDATGTLTLTLSQPSPFLFESLADLSLICQAGMDDRTQLNAGTIGTGPYTLTEAVPEDHYTYTLRDGYTWGPFGATNEDLPKTVTMRIIPDETTAANLLLSKEVNAALFFGPDADRLLSDDTYGSTAIPALMGEMFYNQSAGHATSDPALRLALTQAVDLEALQVALTSGKGTAGTALAVVPPTGCSYDAVSGNLPAMDAAAVTSGLTAAGYTKGADGFWAKDGDTVTLTFIWDSAMGTGGAAAAELAVQQWAAAGLKVEATEYDSARMSELMFATGAWDLGWEPVNLNNPDQILGFLTGPSVADGGVNFAGIANAEYEALTAQAMTMTGAEGCPTWQAAEAALYQAADVIPFANQNAYYISQGATLTYVGRIVPTSIRLK